MYRDANMDYALLDSREEIGFYPWLWHAVPNDTKYSVAWEQLFDEEGFNTGTFAKIHRIEVFVYIFNFNLYRIWTRNM